MLQKSIQLFILLALYLSFGCQEDNDQILRSTVHTFNEVWNTGNYELLSKSVHPEYLKYEGDQKIEGITALSDYIKEFRASIDDVTITYLEEIYGNEKAAIKFTLEGIPKDTGKKFKSDGIVIFWFKEGKIIKDNSVFNQLDALTQQGYSLIAPNME